MFTIIIAIVVAILGIATGYVTCDMVVAKRAARENVTGQLSLMKTKIDCREWKIGQLETECNRVSEDTMAMHSQIKSMVAQLDSTRRDLDSKQQRIERVERHSERECGSRGAVQGLNSDVVRLIDDELKEIRREHRCDIGKLKVELAKVNCRAKIDRAMVADVIDRLDKEVKAMTDAHNDKDNKKAVKANIDTK